MNERKNEVIGTIGNGSKVRMWMHDVLFEKERVRLFDGCEVEKAADAALKGKPYIVGEFIAGMPQGTKTLLELLKFDKYENYLASLGEEGKTDAKKPHRKTVGLC